MQGTNHAASNRPKEYSFHLCMSQLWSGVVEHACNQMKKIKSFVTLCFAGFVVFVTTNLHQAPLSTRSNIPKTFALLSWHGKEWQLLTLVSHVIVRISVQINQL